MRNIVSPLEGIRSPFGPRYGGFSPASLFAAGEQGVWYDPSDFSTMFQDSAGTTPVTAVEQPVGLLLDKSQGLVLGPELITNGNFASPTGWTTGAGATISGGKLNLSAASGYVLYRNAVAGVQVGGYYEVTFTVSGYVSGSIRPYLGATATFGTTVSANGTYTQRFGPTSGGEVGFNSASAFTGAIDDLSVKAISGNHASQATSASRPTLSARVNLLTYSEQFTNAVWGAKAYVTDNFATAPNGTQTAARVNNTGAIDNLNQTVTVVAGVNYTFTFRAKNNGGTTANYRVYNLTGLADIVAVTSYFSQLSSSDWATITVTFTAPVGCTQAVVYPSASNGPTSNILLWGADLRPTNQTALLPAYQRIAAATDYDTTGFPYYLRFDGVDDWMVTGTITPGTDKAQVFAGVRKQSDAALGVLLETGIDVTSASYAGSLAVFAPSGVGVTSYQPFFRGTTGRVFETITPFVSPITNVLTFLMSNQLPAAGDAIQSRANGVAVTATESSNITTAGNFLAYPLYIGSRAGSSLRFNGNLYSLIVRFGSNLDATTISNTETYVNGKTKAY